MIILAAFFAMGTFLDGFAMMVLILPIVLPIIEQLQIPAFLELRPGSRDLKICFGVVTAVNLEMPLFSPPVGMNVFFVKGVARDVSMRDVYVEILPFWATMTACLVILVAVPQLSLVLPNTRLY